MASCGTITVIEPFAEGDVYASDISLPSEVTAGETFEATVTVANDNNVDATADIDLTIDGSSPETTTETIEANSELDVIFDVAIGSDGEYELCGDVSNVSRD